MNLNWNSILQNAVAILTNVGLKVLGAIGLWIVGRWLIGFSLGLIGRGMTRQKIDPTLTRYFRSAVSALLNIALVVAVLGFFGVETTTSLPLSLPQESPPAWRGAVSSATSLPKFSW